MAQRPIDIVVYAACAIGAALYIAGFARRLDADPKPARVTILPARTT